MPSPLNSLEAALSIDDVYLRAITVQFFLLTKVRHELFLKKDVETLSDDELDRLVCRLSPLNIDDASSPDSDPLYFSPAPTPTDPTEPAYLEEFDVNLWPVQYCTVGKDLHASEAGFNAFWIESTLNRATDAGLFGPVPWTVTHELGGRDVFPMDLKDGHIGFRLQTAFLLEDENEHKPHIAGIVITSTIPETAETVIRGEMFSAVALMRRQARRGHFLSSHRVLPVMIYTFMDCKYARITQVHFDVTSNKLVIRQSRLLSMTPGPKSQPPQAAHLLLRWMATTPIGDTTYPSDIVEPVKADSAKDVTTQNNSEAKGAMEICSRRLLSI